MKKIIFFLVVVLFFCSCDKGDGLLEQGSLSVSNHTFSGCLDDKNIVKSSVASIPHIVTLEAEGNRLKLFRTGRFTCAAQIEIVVSNEGNTITIDEENRNASSYCYCYAEYSSQIDGMKDGEYIICIMPEQTHGYYKPFTFKFEEGAKKTIELEFIPY